MYANYDFYRTCYKGNLIDEKDYDRVAGRAADIISCATLGRSDGVLSDTVMHRVKRLVAPFAGEWIEIPPRRQKRHLSLSLPSRERGLKFIGCEARKCVAPSLPSRERGLK